MVTTTTGVAANADPNAMAFDVGVLAADGVMN